MNATETHAQGACPPVLFLIFNRPEMSREVFKQIRTACPNQLFIAADGPRTTQHGEADLCKKTRQTILDLIDWPCEVKTLFRRTNLGCKIAVSSAITWFFEQVENGIILEDDCRPDPTFFRFCSELLEKYRHNERIMMISGNSHLPKPSIIKDSYYFSNFAYIWGWATWKRAWTRMELDMKSWNENKIKSVLPNTLTRRQIKYWTQTFNSNQRGGSSWAIIWQYSCWLSQGRCLNPTVNLVSHIDTTGTHMKPYDPLIGKPAEPISGPLSHPETLEPNHLADRITEKLSRRTLIKNIQLIMLYLLRLSVNPDTSFKLGLRLLFESLLTEMKFRKKNKLAWW